MDEVEEDDEAAAETAPEGDAAEVGNVEDVPEVSTPPPPAMADEEVEYADEEQERPESAQMDDPRAEDGGARQEIVDRMREARERERDRAMEQILGQLLLRIERLEGQMKNGRATN